MSALLHSCVLGADRFLILKNKMKTFNGKAIYNPSGKAGEYSYWACNFYVGCSNGCTYCYLKTGVLAHAMSGDKPTLKKCFKDEEHALQIFEKELIQNKEELQKHGLFFTFTSDPLLKETIKLTFTAVQKCVFYDIPVKILTKVADFGEWWFSQLTSENSIKEQLLHLAYTKSVAFGFTLTGHDELELGASTNAERVKSMKILHESGYKTFASLEPIINFADTLEMIEKTQGICDLYKIGLESGKQYSQSVLREFIEQCCLKSARMSKIYFKDTLLKQAGISRDSLPDYCVDRDYNLFETR